MMETDSVVSVGQIMQAPVYSIKNTQHIRTAQQLMLRHHLKILPVVAGTRPVGLLARTIVDRAMLHSLGEAPVEAIVNPNFAVTTPRAEAQSLLKHFTEEGRPLMLVVHSKNKSLLGVVSRSDLVRHQIASDSDLSDAGASIRPSGLQVKFEKRFPKPLANLLTLAVRQSKQNKTPLYVVGGIVRDLLLGIENLDVDLAVEGRGIAFARELGRTTKVAVKTHARFGTAVLELANGSHVDVAMTRTEYYSEPGTLPTVKPGTIHEDLSRRDFTINSMAIRLAGEKKQTLLDPFNGKRDLQQKAIRVLHPLSFVDDPTRAFRAVRFEVRLGFQMTAETESYLRFALKRNLIDLLSGHRLFNELSALLLEDKAVACLFRMKELALLKCIHPQLLTKAKDVSLLERLGQELKSPENAKNFGEPDRIAVYLSALFWGLDETAFQNVIQRLDIKGKLRRRLEKDRAHCAKALNQLLGNSKNSPEEICRVLKKGTVESRYLLLAVSTSEKLRQMVVRFVTQYQPASELALTGDDLVRLGMRPGPVFQKVFQRLRTARLEGVVQNKQDEERLVRRDFLGRRG